MDVRHTFIPNTTVSLLSENMKLGEYPSFNLAPGVTCPSIDKSCAKCYAMRGHYLYGVVQHAMAERLRWLQDAKTNHDERVVVDKFVNAVCRYPYFRWFGSGDVFDPWMLSIIAEVAVKTPHTQHWLPTRTWRKKEFLPALRMLNTFPNVTVRPSGLIGFGTRVRPHVVGLSAGAVVTKDPTECNCMAQICHGSCASTGCVKCWTVREFQPNYMLH